MTDFFSSLPFRARVMRSAYQAKLNEIEITELQSLADQHMHIKQYCDKFEAAFLLKEQMVALCGQLEVAGRAAFEDMLADNGVRDRSVLEEIRNQMTLYQSWTAIAFRDSVMTISQFDDALKALNIQLKNSASLPVGRTTAPKTWNKTFVEAFPVQKHARNTVAHEAENYAQPARSQSNAVNEPFELGNVILSQGADVTMIGVMTNDSITYSRDGKVLTSRLDLVGVNALKQCLHQIEEYVLALVNQVATD